MALFKAVVWALIFLTKLIFRFVIRMFDQNTSVVIKATKYEIDTFISQVARNHAIAIYRQAYDEQHSFPYQKSNLQTLIGKNPSKCVSGHFEL